MSRRSAAVLPSDTPSASMLARLRRLVASRRRGAACRVLYVFGNPLGNALGDTVIASQSVSYLRRIAPGVELSVWTGDSEMWKRWWPGVETRAALAIEDLDEVDVAVFENTRVPALFKRRLRAAGAALVTWRPSDRHAMFVLGRGVDESVPLPPCSNVPTRSAEVYRALGWPDSAGRDRPPRRSTRTPHILINPYASCGAKSLTPQFLRLLLDAWRRALPAGVELIIPARPGRAGGRDELTFGRLASCAAAAAAGRIVVRDLPLGGFIEEIARAALVIGPDTSSQHIAATCRTPSIACYPPGSGGATYLTWGPPQPGCLHFIVPRDTDPDGQTHLAALVVELGRRLMGHPSARKTLVDGVGLMRAARRFERCAVRWMDGEDGARAELRQLLPALRASVPGGWAPLLFDELAILYRQLEELGGRPDSDSTYLVLTRLPQFTGLKAARILAAPRGVRPGPRRRP